MGFDGPRLRHPQAARLVAGAAPQAMTARRTCAHPDCETPLSRYNPDSTCSVHGGWTDAQVGRPGRKPVATSALPAARAAMAETDVCAEVAVEVAMPVGARQPLLDRLWERLAARGLSLRIGPVGVVVSGNLATVLDAVEEIHRLASRESDRVVTTLRMQSEDPAP